MATVTIFFTRKEGVVVILHFTKTEDIQPKKRLLMLMMLDDIRFFDEDAKIVIVPR